MRTKTKRDKRPSAQVVLPSELGELALLNCAIGHVSHDLSDIITRTAVINEKLAILRKRIVDRPNEKLTDSRRE